MNFDLNKNATALLNYENEIVCLRNKYQLNWWELTKECANQKPVGSFIVL